MGVKVITAPAELPVTLAQARAWCRIDNANADDDAVLQALIRAAVAYAEHRTGRAFVPRTLEFWTDCFPLSRIELPAPPLLEVVSVKYVDTDGVLQTLPTADYEVDTYSEPGAVQRAFDAIWPDVRAEAIRPVRVLYRAGYTAGSPIDWENDLPGELITWLHARVATAYENREQLVVGAGQVLELPRANVDGLLDSLVVARQRFG